MIQVKGSARPLPIELIHDLRRVVRRRAWGRAATLEGAAINRRFHMSRGSSLSKAFLWSCAVVGLVACGRAPDRRETSTASVAAFDVRARRVGACAPTPGVTAPAATAPGADVPKRGAGPASRPPPTRTTPPEWTSSRLRPRCPSERHTGAFAAGQRASHGRRAQAARSRAGQGNPPRHHAQDHRDRARREVQRLDVRRHGAGPGRSARASATASSSR